MTADTRTATRADMLEPGSSAQPLDAGTSNLTAGGTVTELCTDPDLRGNTGFLDVHLQKIFKSRFHNLGEQAAEGFLNFENACEVGWRIDWVLGGLGRPESWALHDKIRGKRLPAGKFAIPEDTAIMLSMKCKQVVKQASWFVISVEALDGFGQNLGIVMQPVVEKFLAGTLQLIMPPDWVEEERIPLPSAHRATLYAAIASVTASSEEEERKLTADFVIKLMAAINEVLQSSGKREQVISHEDIPEQNKEIGRKRLLNLWFTASLKRLDANNMVIEEVDFLARLLKTVLLDTEP